MARWLWVLEKQDCIWQGMDIPTGTKWDELIQSAITYPFKCPLLGRDPQGGQHNETTNPILGYVTKWKEMSGEEARAKGIDTTGEHALYCQIEPLPGMEERVENILYVSPSFMLDAIDERGSQWPMVFRHVAEVAVPFQQLTQPNQRTLLAVEMARLDTGVVQMDAEQIVEEVEPVLEEAAVAAEDAAVAAIEQSAQLEALVAEIRMLKDELAALKGEEAAAAEEGVSMSAKQVRALVAVEMAAQTAAAEILRTRNWTGSKEKLVSMCKDPQTVTLLKGSLAWKADAAPKVSMQKAAAKANTVDYSSMPLADAAKEISRKEGIAFSAALVKARNLRGGK